MKNVVKIVSVSAALVLFSGCLSVTSSPVNGIYTNTNSSDLIAASWNV